MTQGFGKSCKKWLEGLAKVMLTQMKGTKAGQESASKII